MGRRKRSLFDKKTSTTFSLLHAQADGQGDPERVWVEKGRGVGIGRPDPELVQTEAHRALLEGRPPPGHPLALLQAEAAEYSLSEAHRRDLIGLGLPDDGLRLPEAPAQPGPWARRPGRCPPGGTAPCPAVCCQPAHGG